MREWKYSSALAVVGDEWSASRPSRFTPEGKDPLYPLDRKLGASRNQSGRCGEEENIVPVGTRTSAIQPVARRYTDWAILNSINIYIYIYMFFGGGVVVKLKILGVQEGDGVIIIFLLSSALAPCSSVHGHGVRLSSLWIS
jgi:hypothetical protein